MKRFLEMVPIIGLFALLLGPSAWAGQWWLFTVFLVFGIIFGVVEFIAVKKTGDTVSQHFWKLKRESPGKALIVTGGMIIAWALLIIHFWWHK